MNREPGYYWVRFKGDDEWIIGFYDGDKEYPWQIIADDRIYRDGFDIVEVDETPITRTSE